MPKAVDEGAAQNGKGGPLGAAAALFETHLQETEAAAERLMNALRMLGSTARPKPCKGMGWAQLRRRGSLQEARKRTTRRRTLALMAPHSGSNTTKIGLHDGRNLAVANTPAPEDACNYRHHVAWREQKRCARLPSIRWRNRFCQSPRNARQLSNKRLARTRKARPSRAFLLCSMGVRTRWSPRRATLRIRNEQQPGATGERICTLFTFIGWLRGNGQNCADIVSSGETRERRMSEVKIITPNLRGASVIAQNRVHMLFRLTGRSRHLPTLRTTEITDGPEQTAKWTTRLMGRTRGPRALPPIRRKSGGRDVQAAVRRAR